MSDIEQVYNVVGENESIYNPPDAEYFIRQAKRCDLPQVAQLLQQLSTVGEVSENQLDEFESILANSGHRLFVIVQEGRVVACTTLLIEQKLLHCFSKVGHIEDVVVDKEARGLGLGKLLIQFCIQYAQQEGCYKVILDCEEKNRGFYERCGLQVKGLEMARYF